MVLFFPHCRWIQYCWLTASQYCDWLSCITLSKMSSFCNSELVFYLTAEQAVSRWHCAEWDIIREVLSCRNTVVCVFCFFFALSYLWWNLILVQLLRCRILFWPLSWSKRPSSAILLPSLRSMCNEHEHTLPHTQAGKAYRRAVGHWLKVKKKKRVTFKS